MHIGPPWLACSTRSTVSRTDGLPIGWRSIVAARTDPELRPDAFRSLRLGSCPVRSSGQRGLVRYRAKIAPMFKLSTPHLRPALERLGMMQPVKTQPAPALSPAQKPRDCDRGGPER